MIQNLHIVHEDGMQDETGLVKDITDITHEVVYQSASASEVIQWAIDTFSGDGGEIKINRGKFILDDVRGDLNQE